MKKEYKKPELLFDSFELSESIAAGCEYITGQTIDQCAYYTGGRNVFVESVTACTTKTQDGTWDSICYHVPNENSNLFTSA